MWRATLVGLVFVVLLAACGEGSTDSSGSGEGGRYDAYPEMEIPKGAPWVVIATNMGRMTFNLFVDEAPLAVKNFLFLANEGYFDGVSFHRLIPDFMVQGGDPTGTGTGGPGYSFEIEPPQRPYIRGGLAMANKGTPNSNGSQFFISPGRPHGPGTASPGLHALRPAQGGPQAIAGHLGQDRGRSGRRKH